MKIRNYIELAAGVAMALLFAVAPLGAQQQSTPQEQMSTPQPDIQAVSKTGLLPVYGVDFRFDPAWVDGAHFPSQSADFPNFGVNTTFQQVWDNLKPSGFNVLRFPVDVNRAGDAATRVANLCVWARQNNVKLVLLLVGAASGQSDTHNYASRVSAFVKEFVSTLRSGEGKYLQNFNQIMAYQLGDELNHPGSHGGMPPSAGQQLLLQAAQRLRDSEREGLDGTGLDATPQMASVSFDYELVRARAIAGVALTDSAYSRAYAAMKQFLSEVIGSSQIDLIAVDWFAGSVSAGAVDKFPPLLRSLIADFPGKQFVFTTGFSTAFHTVDEQKQFYGMAFANLGDYRASAGVDCPFVGVLFREALNGPEPNPELPKPGLPAEMTKWDWSAKADELTQIWSGERQSADMAWWVRKVENNMGLLNLQSDASGISSTTPQPAQQILSQIASAASEANAASGGGASGSGFTQAVPGAGTAAPGFGQSFKSNLQQALLGLLNVVFQRLGNMLAGGGGGGSWPGGGQPGAVYPSAVPSGQPGGEPGPFGPSILLTKQDVTIQPTNPQVGQVVAITANLRNQSPTDARALVAVAMGEDNSLLAYADNLIVPANSTYPVSLQWAPTAALSSYRISVRVADGSGNELANVSLDPVSVAPSPDSQSSSSGAPTGITGATGGSQSGTSATAAPGFPHHGPISSDTGGTSGAGTQVILPLGTFELAALSVGLPATEVVAGQPSPVSVSLSNPYEVPQQNVKATLIVDGRPIESREIGHLLPHQTRSLVFPGVTFAQAGQHEIKIALESQRPRGRLQKGFVASQIVVRSKDATSVGAGTGVRPVISGSSGTKPAPMQGGPTMAGSVVFGGPVRSVLPPTYHVGRLAVPSTPTLAGAGREAAITTTPPSTEKASEPRPSLSPPTLRGPTKAVATLAGAGKELAGKTTPSGTDRASEPRPSLSRPTLGGTTKPAPSGKEGREGAPVGHRPSGSGGPSASLPPAHADLSVSANDVGYSPSLPTVGQAVTFFATVRNHGNVGVQDATVTFNLYAGSNLVASQVLRFSIGANGFYQASWPTRMPAWQQLQLVVSVGPNRDANPTNKQVSVYVRASGPMIKSPLHEPLPQNPPKPRGPAANPRAAAPLPPLPSACCIITAINPALGRVMAKLNATGQMFAFKVNDAAVLKSLRVGQAVWANFKTGQVSVDGRTVSGTIVSNASRPGD